MKKEKQPTAADIYREELNRYAYDDGMPTGKYIDWLEREVVRLKEYEWMYKDLCK